MTSAMKEAVFAAVIERLDAELARQSQANAQSNATTALGAANADKQRDTTGFEAAFLAKGYALHCLDLARRLEGLRTMAVEDFAGQEIDIGALVEVEMAGERDAYLLLDCGGGIEVEAGGRRVTVVTPESPLGRELMGNVDAGHVKLPSGLEGIVVGVF